MSNQQINSNLQSKLTGPGKREKKEKKKSSSNKKARNKEVDRIMAASAPAARYSSLGFMDDFDETKWVDKTGHLKEHELLTTLNVDKQKTTPPKKKKLGFTKELTRISIDREGKRALFSNATGAIVDKMQQNTPEKKIKRPEVTVASVLKKWEMFKTPNNDEIT